MSCSNVTACRNARIRGSEQLSHTLRRCNLIRFAAVNVPSPPGGEGGGAEEVVAFLLRWHLHPNFAEFPNVAQTTTPNVSSLRIGSAARFFASTMGITDKDTRGHGGGSRLQKALVDLLEMAKFSR